MPSFSNHASAFNYRRYVAAYINKELSDGVMLDPFDNPSFTLWCETSPLLTCPKKDSINRRVIMDLSWPLPPNVKVNGSTSRGTFLGQPKRFISFHT